MGSASRAKALARSRRPARPPRAAPRLPRVPLILAALALIAAFALWQQRSASAPEPVGLAPEISVPLIDGGTFTLSEQRGHPVLVLFTASWCLPCIAEVNKMAQLHDEFSGQGLRQIVVSIDPGDTAQTFGGLRANTRGDKLPWGLDEGQRAMRAYRIAATDTKVLIDASGRIQFTSVGPTALATLRAEVQKALR